MKHIQADDNDLLDLVDKNDEVIGKIQQADAPNLVDTKAGFVRGAVAFIQNNRGELWIPCRTASKRIAPNGLDFSVSEHVQSGESYQEAMLRGFKEELFLDVEENSIEYLGKLDPIPSAPWFFTGVFLYHANEVNEYNQADFTGFEWMLPEKLIGRIRAGEPAKDALIAALALVMEYSSTKHRRV